MDGTQTAGEQDLLSRFPGPKTGPSEQAARDEALTALELADIARDERMMAFRRRGLCSCGVPVKECHRESRWDGDTSGHEVRIERLDEEDRPDPPRCTCGLTTTECRIAGPDNHAARLEPDIRF